MLIIVMTLATLLAAVWFVLLAMVSKEDWIAVAYNKVLDNRNAVEKLGRNDLANAGKLAEYHGLAGSVMRLFLGGNSDKKIAKLKRDSDRLQNGNLKGLNIFIMPGYVLQRKFEAIGRGGMYKTILLKNFELHGKKHAANKTKQLLAKLLSFPIIGVSLSLSIGAMAIGMGNTTGGLAVLTVGTLLVLFLVYALYDEVSDQVNKRRAAIARQFPNVVSKLALLVTSGMIVDRAWKETAASQESELYQEMRRTSEELDNLVTPELAYSNFINRCNTKETAKLASAIMQNLSKGNAEIGFLLKQMAKEAWQERRHTAKRDAEKANSKLMIPTMLLFLAILVMLMVPVAMNFNVL